MITIYCHDCELPLHLCGSHISNGCAGKLPFIFEGDVRFDNEDSGQALIAQIGGGDGEVSPPNMFVRIQSWDKNKEHKKALALINKRVRITIEVID